jgi:hypothetical protein
VNQKISELKSEGFTDKYGPLAQAYEQLRDLIQEASELPNTITVRNEPLPNPEYLTKKGQRDDLWVELQGYNAQKMQMEAQLQEMGAALKTLPEVLRQHESLRAEVATMRQLELEQKIALAPIKDRKLAVSRKGVGALVPFQTLEQPVPAPSPSTAVGVLALAVATLLGLGVALAIVVGKELLRSSFGSAEQARRALKLPVLGEVAPIQTAFEVRRARFVRTLQIAASVVLLTGIGAAIWVCVTHPTDLPRGLVEWALDLRAALS